MQMSSDSETEDKAKVRRLKRINKRPHRYMSCNNCGELFYKIKTKSTPYMAQTYREECPICESKDIEPY